MWNQIEQALNQSAARIITRIARVLPGTLAVIVALLMSAILAWGANVLLKRVLLAVKFDDRMSRWHVSTEMVTRAVSWCIVLTGFLIGVAAVDETVLSQLMARLFAYLPNLVAGVLLLLLGNVIAQFLSRGTLISAVNMNLQYARLLSVGVKWLVWVLAIAMALDNLGIGGHIVSLAFGILFGGIVLALALAVGLGSKELVSRSIERQATQKTEPVEEPFRHL